MDIIRDTSNLLFERRSSGTASMGLVKHMKGGHASAQDYAIDKFSARSGGSRRSVKSPKSKGSSKKVVKKRIVKMMKQGKLVAEKEEILDEEGNVI